MKWDGRIINERELAPYLKSRDGGLAARVAALIEHQKNSWPLLREGYAAFAEIETKSIEANGSRAIIQHNPRRIASTAARVDKASVEARRCFLCAASLLPEEKGIAYDEGLVILCNPFPILDKHLSIVHREHIAQKIEGNVEALLMMARDLGSDFFVLYNGPECGASAPDHLHFQAASRNLPIEDELRRMESESKRENDNKVELFALSGFNRSAIIFRGSDSGRLARSIYRAVSELSLMTGKAEPMINIICAHEEGEWTVYLFPRARHRPACYFAEGEQRLTVSPGAIDMAGLVVVPDRDDFAKVDAERVGQIFSEVSMDYETALKVVEKIGPRARAEGIK